MLTLFISLLLIIQKKIDYLSTHLLTHFKTLDFQHHLGPKEKNAVFARVSIIMRFLTHRDGDLFTYFDINDESEDGKIN